MSGPITLVEDNETELIVRGKFPKRDETAFDRESAKFTTAARCVGEAQTKMLTTSGFTAEQFHGRTGGALVQKLGAHYRQFGSDNEDLTAVASWLSLAAQNVKATKTDINAIVVNYHESYDALSEDCKEKGHCQSELAEEKKALVEQAQKEVDDAWDTYHARHNAIRAGINTGAAAPTELSAVQDAKQA